MNIYDELIAKTFDQKNADDVRKVLEHLKKSFPKRIVWPAVQARIDPNAPYRGSPEQWDYPSRRGMSY